MVTWEWSTVMYCRVNQVNYGPAVVKITDQEAINEYTQKYLHAHRE